jgi:hypothetical protein
MLADVSSSFDPGSFVPPGLDRMVSDQMQIARQAEQMRAETARWTEQLREQIREKARHEQELKLRDDRVAALAEEAHTREVARVKREKWLFVMTVASVVIAVLALIVALVAL